MRAIIMGMRLALIAAAIFSVNGIKVPVDKTDENGSQNKTVEGSESSEKPIYSDSKGDQADSYLVPPNSDHPLEDITGDIATLATYLLPPSQDEQSDYYKPTEAGEQTDWYPIVPAVSPLPRQLLPPKHSETYPISIAGSLSSPIPGSVRTGKVLDAGGRYPPIPSRDLQPPLENAPNEYAASISDDAIKIPLENERPSRPVGYPLTIWNGPNIVRGYPLAQIPFIPKKNKYPTKLYPKKYAGTFKPIPIPIVQLNDEHLGDIQKNRLLKQFKPYQNIDSEIRAPSEDQTIHKFEKGQNQRPLNRKPEENTKIEELESSESNEDVPSVEQDTSATNHREPLRQAYAAPLRQAPKPTSTNHAQTHAPSEDGNRTEFRMHGMKGPHSYQFGFDTGKGKNRQFRYEERDNNGRVKGHYGYMDRNGKLRVVNYDADPEHGFRAEAPIETE